MFAPLWLLTIFTFSDDLPTIFYPFSVAAFPISRLPMMRHYRIGAAEKHMSMHAHGISLNQSRPRKKKKSKVENMSPASTQLQLESMPLGVNIPKFC